MSGHSKWSTIKHKKGKEDARRGQLFSKLSKMLTSVAKSGGGDPNMNARLRLLIQEARSNNMPGDNVDRAIKRGTGELPGVVYDNIIYEGYGPGGVAIMMDILTDNRNRTVAEIRKIFTSNAGNMGESGCVAWMFQRRGLVRTKAANHSEDALLELAMEAGSEDMQRVDDEVLFYTEPQALEAARLALEQKGMEVTSFASTLVPKTTVKVEGKEAMQVLKLIESLEEHEDVQQVYANPEIDDAVVQEYQAS